jgi:hypothetical protein
MHVQKIWLNLDYFGRHSGTISKNFTCFKISAGAFWTCSLFNELNFIGDALCLSAYPKQNKVLVHDLVKEFFVSLGEESPLWDVASDLLVMGGIFYSFYSSAISLFRITSQNWTV